MELAFFLIPFVAVLAPIAIVATVVRYRHRQAQARYDLLLRLGDKGVALSPQLLLEPSAAFCERRRALVLISGGLGIMACAVALPFRFTDGSSLGQLWGLGLLPLVTGLGYLANWWFGRRVPMPSQS